MDRLKKLMNGKNNFLILIGILTVVVAIIGSTYAYFAVSVTSGQNEITGSSAFMNNSLSVVVEQISAGNGGLIPQLGSAISNAYIGTSGKGTCIDANGNTICKAYSIKIVNNTNVKLNVSGTLNLTATDMTYLKWEVGSMSDNVVSFSNSASQHGKAYTTLGTASLDSSTDTSTGASNEYTFYIIIWIEEQNNSQDDKNNFTGIVTFNGYIVGGDNTTVGGITSTIRG